MSSLVIDRVVMVLKECVEMRHGISFSDLKERCSNLEPSQLVRIINPLLKNGMIAKDPITGKYMPGNAFIKMAGHLFFDKKREELIRPIIKKLAEKTKESVAYFQWDGSWIELGVKYETSDSYHYAEEGDRQHRITHTFFRVIQAFLPDRELETLLNSNGENIHDLENVFKDIRKKHIWIQSEYVRSTVTRIVSPVLCQGEIVGAVGITVFGSESPEDVNKLYGKEIKKSAKKIMDMFDDIENSKKI